MSGYELRLVEDNLKNRGRLSLPERGINRVVYVAHGAVEIEGRAYSADSAWHGRGSVTIDALDDGAALWRWELAPISKDIPTRPTDAFADDGRSTVKLICPLAWPIADNVAGRSGASPDAAVLMRADSVSFPPGGCAYLHTHQGPGIRCLIDGGIRIDTDGDSTSYAPGGAWFEAGPVPVFAQGAADRPSRFIRVMILPVALIGKSSIAYVRAEDKDKPKSQSYKGFVDAVIDVT